MCGIAGVISKKKIDQNRFEQMTDLIDYRGPDDRGIWYGGTSSNIALGHRRLSIIDLSDAAHQPFLYEERYILAFNGEIYNYLELKEKLKTKGLVFHTASDTEVLAASYAFWGEDCVNHFNGMWAFAIYDKEEDRLFCARDRYGVKPFYYYMDDERYIFGSEIKQILLMRGTPNRINKDRLADYLISGLMDHTNETMFAEIYQLLPGEAAIFDLRNHSLSKHLYYDISKVVRNPDPKYRSEQKYEEACHEFYRLFQESVKLRLRSDASVGYCLSGGLDSSANVCMSHRITEEKKIQRTVTYCSEYPEYDEQEYADAVRKQTGCEMNKVYSDADTLIDEIDNVIWHQDEPFPTTSIYASWCTFKKAQDCGLKVMIDGQGADEQLDGYAPSYPVFFVDLLKHGRLDTFCREVRQYQKRGLVVATGTIRDQILYPIIMSMLPDRLVRKAKSRIYGNSSKGDYQTPFTEAQIQQLMSESTVSPYKDLLKYRRECFVGLRSLLHYEDRNTMAHSIESRLPFLDYQLVALLGGLPGTYRIRQGRTKAIMRDALKDLLPEKVRNRVSKFGFVSPEDKWINAHTAYFDREVWIGIEQLAQIGMMDYDKARAWWKRKKGTVCRGDSLPWRIVCASRWMELFQACE